MSMIITTCQDVIIMFQQTDGSTTDSDIFWNADSESGLNYVASEKKTFPRTRSFTIMWVANAQSIFIFTMILMKC